MMCAFLGRSYSPASAGNRSPSPKPVVDDVDPELARYLNRSYWEQKHGTNTPDVASPSAPSAGKTNATSSSSPPLSPMIGSGRQPQTTDDPEMDDFVAALKSQVEIFVNRMKSNSSRGRSIANDSSVQTLFMNITAMHSRLLRYIQQQDDERLRFEGLQVCIFCLFLSTPVLITCYFNSFLLNNFSFFCLLLGQNNF